MNLVQTPSGSLLHGVRDSQEMCVYILPSLCAWERLHLSPSRFQHMVSDQNNIIAPRLLVPALDRECWR